jgi:Lrp/AsnC family transcriptional regulator, regulator for asnA, asnC and gidA
MEELFMVDELDKKIIAELRGNARRSYTDIGKKLKISEGTVRNRVKSLQKKNIIKLEAIINPYSIGYNFVSIMGFQVRVAELSQVAEALIKMPNVYYLALVTGRYDLVAIIMTRTSQELSDFIKEKTPAMPSILRSETLVNLEVLKSPWATAWDINKLLDTVVTK